VPHRIISDAGNYTTSPPAGRAAPCPVLHCAGGGAYRQIARHPVVRRHLPRRPIRPPDFKIRRQL